MRITYSALTSLQRTAHVGQLQSLGKQHWTSLRYNAMVGKIAIYHYSTKLPYLRKMAPSFSWQRNTTILSHCAFQLGIKIMVIACG